METGGDEMTYLTTDQAAAELGISRTRIMYYIKSAKLRADKFGRDWAIRRDDFEAFKQRPRRPGWPKGVPRTN